MVTWETTTEAAGERANVSTATYKGNGTTSPDSFGRVDMEKILVEDMYWGDVKNAILEDFFIKDANFSYLSIDNIVFKNCVLDNVAFTQSYMSMSQFENCEIKNCTFEKTHFVNCKDNVKLVAFYDCTITTCDFTTSILERGIFQKTIVKDSVFRKAQFTRGLLSGSSFNGCVFNEAQLGTYIAGCVFNDCDFSDTFTPDNEKLSLTFPSSTFKNTIISKCFLDDPQSDLRFDQGSFVPVDDYGIFCVYSAQDNWRIVSSSWEGTVDELAMISVGILYDYEITQKDAQLLLKLSMQEPCMSTAAY